MRLHRARDRRSYVEGGRVMVGCAAGLRLASKWDVRLEALAAETMGESVRVDRSIT